MLHSDGFEIHRAVFPAPELERMREEASRLARDAGAACVRHIRSRSDFLCQLAEDSRLLTLLPNGLSPVRSILFDKTPGENWPVPWHQDLTIAVESNVAIDGYGPWTEKEGVPHVQPPVKLLRSMVTLRIHLDETNSSNGALKLIPGSHLLGRISSDQVPSHVTEKQITAECHPGDVLAISPLVLHSSRRSEAPKNRRILHFEYAKRSELDPGLSWHERQPRRADLVAGEVQPPRPHPSGYTGVPGGGL